VLKQRKMAKRFTVRSQGPSPKEVFDNLDDAYTAAYNFAQDSGKDVAVIEHEGDTSRLVKKVFHLK